MPVQPPSRSRAARVARPLAALFVVTLLCGTTPEEAQLFAKRRQQIAGMTHADVERLKRNYDEFRKLSPERRQALQDLDDGVKQDTSGHLLKLLNEYNRWLSTLSPFDQERIASKTDAVERAQVVKAIRDEHLKRQALAAIDGFGRQSLMLESSDLDAITKAVEEKFLTSESRKKLPEQLSGRDRHLSVLSAAQVQLRNTDKAAAAGQALVSLLIDAIPNDTVRSRVLNQPAVRQRRRTLGQSLGRSLVNEWQAEIARAFPPSKVIDEELAKRIANGTAGKRDGQKGQLTSKLGRRMVGIQMVLRSDEQFKDLGNVFFWLANGLQPKAAARGQLALPPDDPRTDEAESKTKAGE
jgi:hypothetical protein